MRAVVLAAGEGTRLRPLTRDRPKCLVPLRGRPLLDYQLEALGRAGIGDVTVVTGYRAEQLAGYGTARIHNARFATTNMVASLMCAAARLDGGDDVLVAYADLVYEPRIPERLAACRRPLATAVDLDWRRLWEARFEDPLSDAETLRLDAAGDVVELGRRPRSLEEIEGQYLGLTRISRELAPAVVGFWEALDPGARYDGRARDAMFMTTFLRLLAEAGHRLHAVTVRGGWLEVDTARDLERYEALDRRGALDALCRLDAPP